MPNMPNMPSAHTSVLRCRNNTTFRAVCYLPPYTCSSFRAMSIAFFCTTSIPSIASLSLLCRSFTSPSRSPASFEADTDKFALQDKTPGFRARLDDKAFLVGRCIEYQKNKRVRGVSPKSINGTRLHKTWQKGHCHVCLLYTTSPQLP